MIHSLNHIDGGKCLYNSDTKTYTRLPVADNTIEGNKFFSNGHYYDFFDDVESFLSSKSKMAVVPVFCMDMKKIKKRTKATLLSSRKIGEFFNVEHINGKWVQNAILVMKPKKAYFIFLEKNINAINYCVILASKRVR